MDLLALIIALFSPPALIGAVICGVLGWLFWGCFGAILGLIVGYGVGLWCARYYWDGTISPRAKGWLSLIALLGGLTVLAVATR